MVRKSILTKEMRAKLAKDIDKILRPEITNCFACGEKLTSLVFHDLTKDSKFIARLCDKCTESYKKSVGLFIEQWIENNIKKDI